VGIRVSDSEADLLAEKFHHDDLPEVMGVLASAAACCWFRMTAYDMLDR